MAAAKVMDPELKQYLKENRLPDVYEALLTGLVVMCPDDPLQFIVDKLKFIQGQSWEILQWDMFIEDHMKPKTRMISESNLDWIFNFDENMQPTAEMYEKAYRHYNTRLLAVTYGSWMQFHLHKRRKEFELKHQEEVAGTHYTHRILRVHLHTWIQWVRFRKGRQAMAFNKIQQVYNVAIGRVIFHAWLDVMLDAKETREYFERLERGENVDDDDIFGKGSGEARDDISSLPRPVAVRIFGHVDICDLARCACVCRSWKVITQSNALWSRLDLTKVKHSPEDGIVKQWVTDKVSTKLLSKCRPYLVHLNLRNCNRITHNSFYSIRECRNLQDLNLANCLAVTDDTLKMVLEGCKILLYLNVSGNTITDASLRTVAKQCNNLQYLSISYCNNFTDKGLNYLANGKCAKRLVYLDLSGCLQITPYGYTNLSEGCTELQTLLLNDMFTLDDLCIQGLKPKTTGKFKETTDGCKKLQHVSVLGSTNLSDDAFKALAATKKLTKIKIESNQKISDASFKQIGRLCGDTLKHLYMTDCQRITDMSLKHLSVCRNLTVVNLADCVRISDTGVRYLVESMCGPKLQELNLTNCVRVGDIALVNIHKRCTKLAYLSLCFCEHISSAGIELLGMTHSLTALDISGCHCGDQELAALGNNSRFKDMNLSECVAITDLGLQKFAQQCAEIERLDLSHCQLITDGAVKNLAFCCRMLTFLNLAGCKLLTDLSVQYLSGVCHYLMHLDVSGSLHITDKSMKYLRKGCKKLSILVMLYCRNITKHAYHKMIRHIEQVEYNSEDPPSYYGY